MKLPGEPLMSRTTNALATMGKLVGKLQVMIPDAMYWDLQRLRKTRGFTKETELIREIILHECRGHIAGFESKNITLEKALIALSVFNGFDGDIEAFKQHIVEQYVFGAFHESNNGSQNATDKESGEPEEVSFLIDGGDGL